MLGFIRYNDCSVMESDMEPSTIREGRYTYLHDVNKGPCEAIDVHHILVPRKDAGGLMFWTYALLSAITCFLFFFMRDKSIAGVLCTFTLAGFLLRQLQRKEVERAFGVQLETIYRSGRIIRHFVPIGKILKPVLNECVTPVTCYWSLSLILRGEEELLLVFKELYPPVTMLVPIWKSLCAATDRECIGMQSDFDPR